MKAGEKVKWRKNFRMLVTRTIPKDEYPSIAKNMFNDGLLALLTSEGIQWYAGRYPVTKSSVREIWGLSRAQLGSFERWVYMNDPFMVLVAEEE
tara:strand:+ start:15537 stop:15818 length:282 start_codon:yes stop_codon:yes gene_type:complete